MPCRNFIISDLGLGLSTTNSSVFGTNLHESTRLDMVYRHVICGVLLTMSNAVLFRGIRGFFTLSAAHCFNLTHHLYTARCNSENGVISSKNGKRELGYGMLENRRVKGMPKQKTILNIG